MLNRFSIFFGNTVVCLFIYRNVGVLIHGTSKGPAAVISVKRPVT